VLPDTYDADEDAAELLEEAYSILSAQDLQQLLAQLQGKGIAFSEYRAVLRKAGLATLTDDDAKDEIESMPPAFAPPVLGSYQMPPGKQTLPLPGKPPVVPPPAEEQPPVPTDKGQVPPTK
jgi:hypothetical protein